MGDGFETLSGVKVVSLVFAAIGAALGISYTPDMSKRTAFAALVSGIVCGALGPELLAWGFGWKLPILINNVFALICGIGGMYIIPGLILAWREFATNPWAFLDRLRGIAKPADKDKP